MRSLIPAGTSGRIHLKSQRLWRQWQQVSLELLEQDGAPKEVLDIHCNQAVSRRNSSSCHWIKTFQAEGMGLPLCTGLLTIKLSRTDQFCNSSRNHRIRWTTSTFNQRCLTYIRPIHVLPILGRVNLGVITIKKYLYSPVALTAGAVEYVDSTFAVSKSLP